MAVNTPSMSKRSNLLRYSSWNLASLVLPLFVGLLTIPYLLNQIGVERFGVLGIIWAVVGYFSLFDFGLSKALTKKLAEGRTAQDKDMQRKVFWTAMLMMLGLGLLAWTLVYFPVRFAGGSFLKVSPEILEEVNSAILLIAGFIPLVVVSAGLRGALEAYEEFRAANIIRFALGVWMFLAPALVSSFGFSSLDILAAAIIFGRIIAAIVSWKLVAKTMNGLGKPVFRSDLVRPLFSYGAWITLGGILGPLMSYADRFLVGAVVGATGVAYYTTPQDLALKLLLLPVAVNTALFPLLSKELSQPQTESNQVLILIKKSIAYALLGILPFSLLLIAFPLELLSIWLGASFAHQSASALQMFAIGVTASAIGMILIPILFASNRPDIVAKLYLGELPVFIIASIYFGHRYGIIGTAAVWMVRSVLDTLLIWYFTTKVRIETKFTVLEFLPVMVLGVSTAIFTKQIDDPTIKAVAFLCLCAYVIFHGYAKLQSFTHKR